MQLLKMSYLPICAVISLLLFTAAPYGVHGIAEGEPCNIHDELNQCDPGLVCLQNEPFSNSSEGICYDNCYDIVCPPWEEDCPVGSYYEPGPQLPGRCCPARGACVCDAELCPELKCPEDSIPFIVTPADERDGRCCNQYTCKPVTCALYLDQPLLLQDGESLLLDECTNCTCITGELICEPIVCPLLECGELEVMAFIPGQCCAVCTPREVIEPLTPEPQCTQPEGRLFRDPEDPCLQCRCSRGRKSCVGPRCPPLKCANPVKVPGLCCPACPSEPEVTSSEIVTREATSIGPVVDPFTQPECSGNGVFRVSNEPCKICRCINGVTRCIDQQCPPASCENPIQVPGTCCPVCPDVTTTEEQQRPATTNSPETNFEIAIVLNIPTVEYFELENAIRERAAILLATIGYQLQRVSRPQALGKSQTQLEMVIENTNSENSLTREQLRALLTEELHTLFEEQETPRPSVVTTADSTIVFSRESSRDLVTFVLIGAFSATIVIILSLIGTAIVIAIVIRFKRNRLAKRTPSEETIKIEQV